MYVEMLYILLCKDTHRPVEITYVSFISGRRILGLSFTFDYIKQRRCTFDAIHTRSRRKAHYNLRYQR